MQRSLLTFGLLFLLSACGGSEKNDTAAQKDVTATPQTHQEVKKESTPAPVVEETSPKSTPEPVVVHEKNDTLLDAKEQKVETIHDAKSEDGFTLYTKRCASCHGKGAEKSALNASQAIAGWESTKIQEALKGYNNDTYGGKMKAVMKAQSQSLSDDERARVADYISTL